MESFEALCSKEWIETNGLGGYASGTVSGAHSRRYHGLLVAATHPPVGRMVVLSKLDDTIVADDERFELSSNQYPGTVHPQGFQFLESFERLDFPVWHYRVQGILLKKTIAAIHGENTTVIFYEVVEADRKFELELMPLYACRDFHGLAHENTSIKKEYEFHKGIFSTQNYDGCPQVYISVPGATFHEQPDWYRHFQYSVEQYRGLDFQEDLFAHGKFKVSLAAGEKLGIVISTDDVRSKKASVLLNRERKRRDGLAKPFTWNDHLRQLALAADQFIVKRGNLNTIIAGYHWFSDWGRDTMIALPGLCLATGRFMEAKNILQAFAENVSEGMLPNRFPDYGEAPEYNTIDATLWFFHAVYRYYQYTADLPFVKSVLPVLEDIVSWHYKGTRFGIRVDAQDELIYGGQEGVQLTWMDAKVGDWVVTPRKGKPVEINALWFNALSILSSLTGEAGEKNKSQQYSLKAMVVQDSFNKLFWNERQHCLYDFIDGDFKNDDLRPNQLYAVSLPFPLLSVDKAERVLDTVTNYLLTHRGLRSLSQSHKEYKPVYGGSPWHRDGSYHQGTVWSFLLGPYIDALLKVKGARGKGEATRIVKKFLDHLDEAGVGTVSEIFDADPPHTSRGCIAQAWGVAEVLRVAVEHDLFLSPKKVAG